MIIAELRNVTKIYGSSGAQQIRALNNVSFIIKKGDFISIMGPSGSGKSTMLNILGCMDTITTGEYVLNGKVIKDLSDVEMSKIRNKNISFIFQNFALLKDYTVYENIEMILNCRKNMSSKEKKKIIYEYVEKLKIKDIMKKKIFEISGGQQQRVAIARALVSNAEIILADEPTGALDSKTGQEVLEILKKINKEGKTIIMVTHDSNVAKIASRCIQIIDGELFENSNTSK